MKALDIHNSMLRLLVLFLLVAVQGCTCDGEGDDSLLVASFNIQIFGQSKVQKKDVVDVILRILARYDLVMIMEIRDSKETAFPQLVSQLNDETGDVYEYVTSKRSGRSSSKEQYGFIYRKDKLLIYSMYESSDVHDTLEREPLVVRFRRTPNKDSEWDHPDCVFPFEYKGVEYETCTNEDYGNNMWCMTDMDTGDWVDCNAPSGGQQQAFTFIPMHTKPTEAIPEMNSLVDVYYESTKYYGENAVIAGDLNADCSYVCKSCWENVRLRTDTTFQWLIDDDTDTTVSNTDCAYDRVILAGKQLQKNSCCAKVFNYQEEYGLTLEMAKDVSDHFPVEFRIN